MIKDIRACRVMNVTTNTTNRSAMKANYSVHIVTMLVIMGDAIRLVRKVAGCANMAGQCNRNWVVVLTLMNVQRFKIRVRKINFV